MAFWEYTLTGFGDFLEQRRVAFAEPIPADRVCSTCGRLPSEAALLPCSHVLCLPCTAEVCDAKRCPFDGEAVTEEELVLVHTDESFLEKRRVVCVVGGRKCASFTGKLSKLRDHLYHCRIGDVHCVKCYRPVAREAAVEHYKQCCCDSNGTLHSATDVRVRMAVEEIRGIKEDLEKLRQRALDGRDGDDDLVNGANVLVERLASLAGSLSAPQEEAGRVQEGSALQPSKTRVPGPFRAASKPGVYVTTCRLENVYGARYSLTRDNKERRLCTEQCMLGGYTFKLLCKFLLLEGEDNEDEVSVSFTFFLRSGDWDDFLEWPFSKKVTFIIGHPTDESKDIRLMPPMEGHEVLKKPGSRDLNLGNLTAMKSWNELEFEGFIVRGALYVNVEFE
ncbi:hypothetical protein HPB50_002112 [Hyalomma asiaticum]|uniref:Uncharacterized protein n=1 Tax=Hyalomma asiaticum TaxID=266040 RepID=A0ACB7RKZ1_HYAAI|nr:hypothetical protein HPB50_002112 [Hyalomma asiaticum]